MRTRLLIFLLAAASCAEPPVEEPRSLVQTRTVVGRPVPPNALLLVDVSAAMALPGPGGKQCLRCVTQLDEVKKAAARSLGQWGSEARYGLAVSPGADGCQAAGAAVEIVEPVDAATSDRLDALQARADAVAGRLRALTPRPGPMPLAAALAGVGALPALADASRNDFVLLLTAGAPGCGAGDPVQAVVDLRAKGIRTVVFGVGPGALEPSAEATLNAMAAASGFVAACPMGLDSECGGLRCMPSRVCERKFFHAEDAARLAWWLERVTAPVAVAERDVCRVWLDHEVLRTESLLVLVDGNAVQSGPDTWTSDGLAVTFQGALCQRLKDALPSSPVSLEFRFPLP